MPEPRTAIAPPAPPHSETRVGETTNPAAGGDADTPEQVGRFRLLWELARGGMGVVFRAIDTDLNRVVAVKLVRGANDPAAKLRFVEEAKVTAQLQHPGIPPVYEAGELPDGRPYLAMKLIKGRTLADLLADRKELSDDRPRFVAAFESIAQAIGYAHSQGVIHRDLKPQNVMVGAFGEVQVMDWGLARTAEREGQKRTTATTYTDGAAFRTVVGSVVGTPAFCAPEQARGELDVVGERSDVFGLGAVLCSILTGRPPFDAPDGTTALVRAAAGDTTEAFANLEACGADAELIALCKQCLAADPNARPATGKEVADEVARLRAAADERAKAAEVEAAKAATRAAAQRVRQRLMLIAVVVLTAIGLVAGWQWVRAEGESERAWQEQKKAESEQAKAEAEKQRAEGEQKRAEGEQIKAEEALGQVKVEQGKTKDALDAKTDEQKKTAAALAEVQAGRRRSLAALRQLTNQVVDSPFHYSWGRGLQTDPAVGRQVAELWDEFAADADPELAAEAGIWAAALRWDRTRPADTVTRMSAALERSDALAAPPKSPELQRAAAIGPGFVSFARSEGGRVLTNVGDPSAEYRTSVERLRVLAAAEKPSGEYHLLLAAALASVANLDHHRPDRRAACDTAARESLKLRAGVADASPHLMKSMNDRELGYTLLFRVWGPLPLLWPADAEPLLRAHLAHELATLEAWKSGKGSTINESAVPQARRRLAGWLMVTGAFADAEKGYRAAVEKYDALLKNSPGRGQLWLESSATLTELGDCLLAAGKAKEAVVALERCVTASRELGERWKNDPFIRNLKLDPNLELADSLAYLAHAHAATGDAKKAADTAAECRQLTATMDAKTVNYGSTIPRVLGQLALAEITLRMADQDTAAVPLLVEKFDAELAKLSGPRSSVVEAAPLRWELAKCLMKAADPAAAVKQLSSVCGAGFSNRELLAAEFAPLKDRDDFKKLLAQLPEAKK